MKSLYCMNGEYIALQYNNFIVIGVCLTLFMIVTLIKAQHTPIVRATNFRTSLLQLFTLVCLFVLPTLLLYEDDATTCAMREYGVWILYTLLISITLSKSTIIYQVIITIIIIAFLGFFVFYMIWG